MRRQTAMAVLLAGAALTAALLAGLSLEASGAGEPPAKAPRYSETCAHGHNGFNCEASSMRTDIEELQERVSALETRR